MPLVLPVRGTLLYQKTVDQVRHVKENNSFSKIESILHLAITGKASGTLNHHILSVPSRRLVSRGSQQWTLAVPQFRGHDHTPAGCGLQSFRRAKTPRHAGERRNDTGYVHCGTWTPARRM